MTKHAKPGKESQFCALQVQNGGGQLQAQTCWLEGFASPFVGGCCFAIHRPEEIK